MLDLSGWVVDKTQRQRHAHRLFARYVPEPDTCPRCGADRRLIRGPRQPGVKQQQFQVLPRDGKRATLCVSYVRYRCLTCRSIFLQPLPDIARGRRLTRRLLAYIEAGSATLSNSSIAQEVGVDEKTIRNIVR